jgi:hypothetical protein
VNQFTKVLSQNFSQSPILIQGQNEERENLSSSHQAIDLVHPEENIDGSGLGLQGGEIGEDDA